MKESYEKPVIDVKEFSVLDVITTSDGEPDTDVKFPF
jgi:hypothetical protein